MNLKLKIMLFYASKYSITENGKTNEGVTIQYLITDNLNPVKGIADIGLRVTKGSLPLEEMANIITAPAIYEGEFTMKTGSDGKAALKLVTLSYIKDIKTA